MEKCIQKKVECDELLVSAVVVAAGQSTRMKGVNKQMLTLGSVPLIAKTLLRFQNCHCVSSVVLVCPVNCCEEYAKIAAKYGITKLYKVVGGGKTRQESVLNGILALPEGTENVLIHDGARPFVTEEVICRVASALKNQKAVVCAVPVKDTLKQVDQNGKILSTPNRSSLVAAQTPQGVSLKEYRYALEKSEDLSLFTDDMSVMEAAGYEAYTVMGDYRNIKVTTPDDIKLAEFYTLQEGL